MSDPTCYGSLQLCRTRVSLLAPNGEPLPGDDNGYVTAAAISFDLSTENADDVDLSKLNGCGDLCQSFFKQGAIKRATLSGSFCELDLQLGNLLLGGAIARKGLAPGTPFGYSAPLSSDPAPDGVCLEFWTKAWDGTEQATPASLSNAAANWHWVFPKAKFSLDTVTMENDFMEFAITGFSTENSSMQDTGPFDDWDADWALAGGGKSCFNFFLEDEADMPDATCAFITVPALVS